MVRGRGVGVWWGAGLIALSLFTASLASAAYHDYCVIGAGPAGLQMGYFLHQAHRDYVILERNNHSGSFFSQYPRHRKLISINKRFTGRTNAEFNLRHDWNSLLSHDDQMLFTHFSHQFFPEADAMVRYLGEFASRFGLHVRYSTTVRDIQRHPGTHPSPGWTFSMRDQHHHRYTCRYVIVATGLSVPNAPAFPGSDQVLGYEDVPIDPKDFQGQNVLILGRGNAAFETADAMYGSTNMVHMVSRSRARLSWNTHYVGDLRAINNGLLDTYQLKSLDGLLEAAVEDMVLERRGGRIYVQFPWEAESLKQIQARKERGEDLTAENDFDNFSLREGYDRVIRCLGFKFDFSIFSNGSVPSSAGRRAKYPEIKRTYEATNVAGLYFAGTIAHSLDYRKSAGGFVHGFRYTVKVLHRLLEWRHEGQRWPVTTHSTADLLNVLVKRINEASAPYQMFGVLGDLVLFRDGGRQFELLEDFPVQLLARVEALTGREAGGSVVVALMEYGPEFSGPDKDTFRVDRATGDPLEAHRSNFLHPVFYHYKNLPSEADMLHKMRHSVLPRPDRIHHVLEDFLTVWTAQQSHILPLRRFLEYVTGRDLRHHTLTSCLHHTLTTATPPPLCPHGGSVGGWGVLPAAPVTQPLSYGLSRPPRPGNYTLWTRPLARPPPPSPLAAAAS